MDELQSNSPLLSFYLNEGTDHKGRTLDAILAQGDSWLESTHDYVQWLFPLGSHSGYNPDAPTLDTLTIRSFAGSSLLQANQRRAFTRMMLFYGFSVDEDTDGNVIEAVYVDRSTNFIPRSRLWLTNGNHNYKRLTRILSSLSVLGSPLHARGLGEALRQVYRNFGGRIGRDSFAHWESAWSSRKG